MNNRFKAIQAKPGCRQNRRFAPVVAKASNPVYEKTVGVLSRLAQRSKHWVAVELIFTAESIIIQKSPYPVDGRRSGLIDLKDRIEDVQAVAAGAKYDEILHETEGPRSPQSLSATNAIFCSSNPACRGSARPRSCNRSDTGKAGCGWK